MVGASEAWIGSKVEEEAIVAYVFVNDDDDYSDTINDRPCGSENEDSNSSIEFHDIMDKFEQDSSSNKVGPVKLDHEGSIASSS